MRCVQYAYAGQRTLSKASLIRLMQPRRNFFIFRRLICLVRSKSNQIILSLSVWTTNIGAVLHRISEIWLLEGKYLEVVIYCLYSRTTRRDHKRVKCKSTRTQIEIIRVLFVLRSTSVHNYYVTSIILVKERKSKILNS